MQITAKKHKDDHQLELAQPTKTSVLVQPTKTSTQNLEENLIPSDKYRSLKAKVKAMPIQISDKLKKHLIPNGEATLKHFTLIEFVKHIKNNDIILSGEAKNELLKETETLINSNSQCGHLELSTVLRSSMSSDSEPQDFP